MVHHLRHLLRQTRVFLVGLERLVSIAAFFAPCAPARARIELLLLLLNVYAAPAAARRCARRTEPDGVDIYRRKQ